MVVILSVCSMDTWHDSAAMSQEEGGCITLDTSSYVKDMVLQGNYDGCLNKVLTRDA